MTIVHGKDFSDFEKTLKRRVNDFLRVENIDVQRKQLLKAAVLLSVWGASYCAFLLSSSPLIIYSIACFLGILHVIIIFNFGHDNVHVGRFRSKYLNAFFNNSFVLAGIDPEVWRYMHNVIHHTYTNIDGKDIDLETKGIIFLRFTRSRERSLFIKYQYITFPFLYLVLTLWWCLFKDVVFSIRNRNNKQFITRKAAFFTLLIVRKVINFSLFFVIPWQVSSNVVLAIVPFVIIHFSQSLFASLIIQTAHLSEKPRILQDSNLLTKHRDAHQLITSSSFSNTPIVNWLMGGLNFQIEHHLFPWLSYWYYPKIAAITRQTAKEFDLPYNYYESVGAAVLSHYRYMKHLSKA